MEKLDSLVMQGLVNDSQFSSRVDDHNMVGKMGKCDELGLDRLSPTTLSS